ncbi:tRNA (adenosine(37)-N6)-threonylcarbamoyltransferase complex dimerization subunit type 1 TsaB [Paenibacillaceae bacterium WGS1546]|uniref:tRNA (adenosine(37)-N6)-threonylcarbamoyltransferase complex dimerization subunit type 1 TsaB n=1 Tax=Cohnella sp. WGS1546 TaxID=3366810 RepID=UPI00372D6BCF
MRIGEDGSGAGGSATVLAFDTSTAAFAASIVKDGALVDSVVSFAERNHSVRVLSEIQELLRRNGLTGGDLDAIVAGRGPGSYTGVRIAVTAAKTLAWAWNKPLIGVSSLEALALGAWLSLRRNHEDLADDRDVWIVPIMDARRGQVYTARYAAGHSPEWRTLDADGIRMIGEWAGRIEDEGTKDDRAAAVWFVGDLELHREAIARAEQAGIRLRVHACAMDPCAIGLLGEFKFRSGHRDNVHAFVPNYTQLAEAEAKLLAAKRGE